MRAGIVGFPGAGRRTLFCLLTHTAEVVSGHQTHIGVLKIPDPRLENVARIHVAEALSYRGETLRRAKAAA